VEGFGPWLAGAEKQISNRDEKPKALDEINSFEQNACGFLKEVVKANKMLQRVQAAAEGIKGKFTWNSIMVNPGEWAMLQEMRPMRY